MRRILIAGVSEGRHLGYELRTLVLANPLQMPSSRDAASLQDFCRLGAAYAWPAFHECLCTDIPCGIAAAGKHLARVYFPFLYSMKEHAPLVPHGSRSCKILAPLFRRKIRQVGLSAFRSESRKVVIHGKPPIRPSAADLLDRSVFAAGRNCGSLAIGLLLLGKLDRTGKIAEAALLGDAPAMLVSPAEGYICMVDLAFDSELLRGRRPAMAIAMPSRWKGRDGIVEPALPLNLAHHHIVMLEERSPVIDDLCCAMAHPDLLVLAICKAAIYDHEGIVFSLRVWERNGVHAHPVKPLQHHVGRQGECRADAPHAAILS